MFEVDRLTKRFSGIQVLDAVSFAVAPREIVGYYQAQQMGKTTTIRMIAGLLEPTSGHVIASRGGQRPRRNWTGALATFPKSPRAAARLTARESLRLVGGLEIRADRLERQIGELLRLLNLERAARRRDDAVLQGDA